MAAAPPTDPEANNTALWKFGLCNCFDDLPLCISTFLCPCYTLGRNAQALGEDGCKAGVMCGMGLTSIATVMRWRLRQREKIAGNMFIDAGTSYLLPCCAIMQENRQLYGSSGSHVGEKLPLAAEIQRQ